MVSENENILIAQGLHKWLGRGDGRNHVLRGLDLEVRKGEFLAIMGPSGCGKSTLLHALGLMSPPDEGSIAIAGEEAVDAAKARQTRLRRHKIGFVFQRFNLLSTVSAIENIRISLKVRGLKDTGQAGELLEAMGVSHVANRKPGQMSIGEQQRVAAARALAHKPAILLADEPTGNLDSENGQALLDIFRQINQQQNQTIVMITHSPTAANQADRVIRMRDGKIDDTTS